MQQVEAGGRVQVCVTHQLAGEERLPGATAQEAAHLTVGYVHPVGQHLRTKKCDKKHIRDAQIPEASPEELTFTLS